ncbi:hypothetical protein Rt10032_c02g0666 [Rhodotorula toruloides]|uniref:Uncharacterized protein n=1 Tax=Rhodotorula toruloides TaxID=5286 RepID=A0A511K8H2_RHOTO|nr:hypothetical protein Rt10032_c02g0666 [Rhodotorula toruloides]
MTVLRSGGASGAREPGLVLKSLSESRVLKGIAGASRGDTARICAKTCAGTGVLGYGPQAREFLNELINRSCTTASRKVAAETGYSIHVNFPAPSKVDFTVLVKHNVRGIITTFTGDAVALEDDERRGLEDLEGRRAPWMAAKSAGEASTATAPRLQRTRPPLDQPPTFDDAGRRQLLLLGLFVYRVAHGFWSAEESDSEEAVETDNKGKTAESTTALGPEVPRKQGADSATKTARKQGEGTSKARKTGPPLTLDLVAASTAEQIASSYSRTKLKTFRSTFPGWNKTAVRLSGTLTAEEALEFPKNQIITLAEQTASPVLAHRVRPSSRLLSPQRRDACAELKKRQEAQTSASSS